MKTLQELLNAVTEAKQAYDKAASLPLITSRNAVLAMRRREYRAAVIAFQNAKRREELDKARRDVASLKAANLELSEARSAAETRVQELQNTNNQLNTELARETLRAQEFSAEAGVLAQRVKEYEAGNAELREMFVELNPPATARGIKGLLKWLIEQNAVLREVNAKRDVAHVPAPEVVAAAQSIPGADSLTVAPLDDWTLEYLRRWWARTTDEQHRIDAFAVLAEAVARRDKRGLTWTMIVMMVNDRIAPCQITASRVIEFPTSGPVEIAPAG
jgi:hypothetical protein